MKTENKRTTPHVARQNAVNALMEECQVFWAFSQSQFAEGKAKINLEEGEKLVDIGAGGFMPTKNRIKYLEGMKAISLAFTEAMKDEKVRLAHIRYELDNHEAYDTYSIESTLEALGEDFTREEVLKVFKGR